MIYLDVQYVYNVVVRIYLVLLQEILYSSQVLPEVIRCCNGLLLPDPGELPLHVAVQLLQTL